MYIVENSSGQVSGMANDTTMVFLPGTPLDEVERVVILETLKYQGNNRTRAAITLGIGIRTLQRKLKKYGVAQAS